MPVLRDPESRHCRCVFTVWEAHAGQSDHPPAAAFASSPAGRTNRLSQVS